MNNRSQFIGTPDPIADQVLLETLNSAKQINCTFANLIYQCVQFGFPEEYTLTMHSFSKIQLAIDSCLLLIRNGYYGTARAIYRQIYEFILWARVSLTVSKEELHTISENFFSARYSESENGQGRNKTKKFMIIPYIRKNITWTVPTEFSNSISKDELETCLKDYFFDLCAATHASNESQQLFFIDDSFYEHSMEAVRTLVALLGAAADVFNIYLDTEAAYLRTQDELHRLQVLPLDSKTIDMIEKTDKLLGTIDPNKGPGMHMLNVALRGTWSSKSSGSSNKK